MEELDQLFAQAQTGDLDAYGGMIRRFQDMAVGYAYSILGDFHLAEDASQEAFIETYLHLGRLYGPAVFSTWLRRAVYKHCDRLTRRRRVATIPLEDAPQVSSGEPAPDEALDAQQTEDSVRRAIQALPEKERAVTTLFYIGGHAQSEIGAFLEIPTKTVKSRLHTARSRLRQSGSLRERMIDMVEEQLHDRRPSRDESFTVSVIDDLTLLTDQEIQRLLRMTSVSDVVTALQGTGADVQERIFANVSKGIATLIRNEMAISGRPEEAGIESVREGIVKLAQRLVLHRRPAKPGELGEEYWAMKEDLRKRLSSRPLAGPGLGLDEIVTLFETMARVCRAEGILELETGGFGSLEKAAPGTQEELFNLGLYLIVNGTGSRLTATILDARTQTLMNHHTTRCRMITEGLTAIRDGSLPSFIDLNLRNFYMSAGEWDGEYPEKPLEKLRKQLRERPFTQFTLDEVTQFLLDLSVAVRQEGGAAVAGLADLVDDELLQQGMEAMQMFEGSIAPELVQRLLEIRTRTLLHRHETGYLMIAEGFRSIQNGEHPRLIAEKLRSFSE